MVVTAVTGVWLPLTLLRLLAAAPAAARR